MVRGSFGARGAMVVGAFAAAFACLPGGLMAQNFTGIGSDISTVPNGSSIAAMYAGPHSGECPVLIIGGGATGADDQRGVVIDGGSDAFDSFGFLNVNNVPNRSIQRRVTRIYTGPGGHSAYRWADTITNTSGLPQVFQVRFGGEFGADETTATLTSGFGFRIVADAAVGPFGDPVIAIAWGVNGVSGSAGTSTYAGAHGPADGFVVSHTILLAGGASATFIHLAMLGTPDLNGAVYAADTAFNTVTQVFTAATSGVLAPQFPEPLNPGCDQPGPIVNWYAPHSGLIHPADVWNGAMRTASYAGPHDGSAPPLIGVVAISDERGAIGDGGGDPFDTFGLLHVSGSPATRTVQRSVQTFSTACDSGWRWVDTVTNTSGATTQFQLAFGGNLGSDASTVVQSDGVVYRVSTQGSTPNFSDPPVALVWGNNDIAADATSYSLDGEDDLAVAHVFELAPGESATFVHFALVGDQGPGGDNFTQQRAMHLVARGRKDRLFQGVTASNILNWREEPSCKGDYNGDGFVDLADLIGFNIDWQPNIGQNCP